MVAVDKKTKPSALIDDTLRLHALEPLRLKTAKAIANDVELEYEHLTLVMLRNADYIYAVDMDDAFEHKAIAVDADGNGSCTSVYSFNNGKENFYYLAEDLKDWRYRYYQALMKIAKEEKGKNGFDERWAFDEASALSKEALVEAMTWNTPEAYADMVSM